MTTYLLHGGMLAYANPLNDAYFRRITDAVPEGGTVLIVLFAAAEERWPELFDSLKGYLSAQAGGKKLNFVLASKGGFLEEVAGADAVVIRGGSTDRLLEALRAYPDLGAVFMGKIVAGSSAGAYAIAAYGYDKSEKAQRAGFSLVPVRVLCHFESPSDDGNGADADALMQSAHQELPLIVLRDCEWKEFAI